MELKGTFTAMVTPFNRDLSLDEGRLRALVEEQVAAGIDGIVPVGTTGESPTLSFEEHFKVVEIAVDAAAGRLRVIAGTGGNSTDEAIELTRHAQSIGADASLQVCPYYNKPSQEGLYRHYAMLADLGLPVVLYNVPGRTGREIAIATVARLASHPNVVAIKEAAGDANRVSEIHAVCDLTVISGDDSLTIPMMSVGARGVISVASNVIPREVVEMVRFALADDFVAARAAHRRLFPLFRDLFIDTNPVPIKAAMAMRGLIEETYRLPLCELSDAARQKLTATMQRLGLL